MEAWPIEALKAAPMSGKLEITQNAKSCSKYEKLPKSCQKVAEQLVASPRIGHSGAEN